MTRLILLALILTYSSISQAHPLSHPILNLCKSLGNFSNQAETDCYGKSIRTLDTYQSILASIKRAPEKATSVKNLNILKETLESEKVLLPQSTYNTLSLYEQAIRTAIQNPTDRKKVKMMIESINRKLDFVHNDLAQASKERGSK